MSKFNKQRLIKRFSIGLSIIVLTVISYFSDVDNYLWTNVVGFPEHAAFDGTIMPVKKVPNWVKISPDKWNLTYSQLDQNDLIDIPLYNPEQLKISTDNLKWGDANDDIIRIAKITYSVPYLGNYLLDGEENSGSHPAVDIKIPTGTPIFSFANGTVVKVSNIDSGFGYHVVVQHNNFPSLKNPGEKIKIYSSYSHLSQTFVQQGDVVTKGQQIALSGSTGTATTPHLHFQIDTDDAPWHPFWPFSAQEAYDAGLNFFTAVNAGLGKEKAVITTISPLQYAQKYLDPSVAYVEVETSQNDSDKIHTDNSSTVASSYVASLEKQNVNEEPEKNVIDVPEINIEIEVKDKYYSAESQNADFQIYLRDQYGNPWNKPLVSDIVVTSEEKHVAINKPILMSLQFKDAMMVNSFKSMNPGKERLKVVYGDQLFYSQWFEILDGQPAKDFNDIPKDSKYYDAVGYLYQRGVISGYPDNTFRPDNYVSRIESLKFILETIDIGLKNGKIPFSDVSSGEWYSAYLYTAYKDGLVKGYPDGKFRPKNTVNKAEFYKMLLNSMEPDLSDEIKKDPFPDVKKGDWFAPYFNYFKEKDILDSDINGNAKPFQQMTRGEVAITVYKLLLDENSI